MTSSFNLSRRPKQKATYWDAYFRNEGICPPGFVTQHVGNHGWKICTPVRDFKTGKTWMDGSANEYANHLHWPGRDNTSTFSATLYDPNQAPHWLYGFQIPYQMRRQLHEPRALFDRYDYYRLPVNYNGTGYEPVRSWPQEGGKVPQYAEDNVDVPPVWDPFRFAQPYPMQQMAVRGDEKQLTSLNTRGSPQAKVGGFYGEAKPFPELFNRNCFS
jgi:hypothetical protein